MMELIFSLCETLLAYKKLLANNIKLFHSTFFKKIYKLLKTGFMGNISRYKKSQMPKVLRP